MASGGLQRPAVQSILPRSLADLAFLMTRKAANLRDMVLLLCDTVRKQQRVIVFAEYPIAGAIPEQHLVAWLI